MENKYKEVYFNEYCKTCEYRDLEEKKNPCNECLEIGFNLYSNIPVKWKSRREV